MAKSLTLRDIPEDVLATIRVRAAAAGMSVQQYSLQQLTAAARVPTNAEVAERLRSQAAERAAAGDTEPSVDDILQAIKEGRE
ncbi:MAG: antitoxin [Streptosporangiales bacterium]|nr:antitoxin [Streptosporangiales bacterium]